MNTYLGASALLVPGDVDEDLVARGKVVYLEGYLFDKDESKAAYRKAAEVAHRAGGKVSLTLSDSFCVERHRADFFALVEDQVDLLFANEHELMALYQVDDFDDALQAVRGHCEIAAITRGKAGSVVVSGDEVHVIDADPVRACWTPPVPETSTPPASSTAGPTASGWPTAAGSGRWPPPR
jgi:sugar/nucleoside kinase (ribokinase family)